MARRHVYPREMEPRGSILMGVDPSSNNTAALALPTDWNYDWTLLRYMPLLGKELTKKPTVEQRLGRCRYIASELVEWARANDVRTAFIEHYAFNQKSNAHSAGELGYAIRNELLYAGIEVVETNMSTARQTLLGRVKRGDPKGQVKRAWVAAGFPCDRFTAKSLEHYLDAATCLNQGLVEREHAGYVGAAPTLF